MIRPLALLALLLPGCALTVDAPDNCRAIVTALETKAAACKQSFDQEAAGELCHGVVAASGGVDDCLTTIDTESCEASHAGTPSSCFVFLRL